MWKYISKRFYIELILVSTLYVVAGVYFIRIDAFELLTEYVMRYERWEIDEFLLLLALSPLMLLWLCARLAIRAKIEIKARHQSELDALEQLKFDPQTGLSNFRYFESVLDQQIHDEVQNTQYVLYLFSFENYRELCERHPIEVIDDLFLRCTKSIKTKFSDQYLIARTGQNEVAIAFKCTGHQNYQVSFQLLQSTLNDIHAIKQPHVECRAAVAYIESGAEVVNTRRLLTKARSAIFTRSGFAGSGIYVYDQDVENRKLTDLQMIKELKRAIERDELELYYQPQVDLYLGLTVGSEALIRWNHPISGLLTPDKFVHLLDHESICLEFGQWLFSKAVSRLDSLSHRYPEQTVSINISASHIQHPYFFTQLTQALDGYSSTMIQKLVIEVTESFKLSDHEKAFENMRKCKALGAKVSLDDFGTGYSSLNQLRVLPIDEIKIDRTFISNILTDSNDFKLVSSLFTLAENFELDVVTEGVENANQIEKLLMVGCRRVQGYYYSKPVPEKEFDQWLEESAVQSAIM